MNENIDKAGKEIWRDFASRLEEAIEKTEKGTMNGAYLVAVNCGCNSVIEESLIKLIKKDREQIFKEIGEELKAYLCMKYSCDRKDCDHKCSHYKDVDRIINKHKKRFCE